MAKTLEQIQQEFNAITLTTKEAYDKLQNLGSSKKFIRENKALYDAAQKAYKDAKGKSIE